MTTELENAYELQLTLDEARSLGEGEGEDDKMTELLNLVDEAQGEVHQGNTKVAYVIIKIVASS